MSVYRRASEVRQSISDTGLRSLQEELQQALAKIKETDDPGVRRDRLRELRLILVEFDLQLLELPD
jgi:hypothetical protein